MKNYESSKLKDVLEAPLLLENNFTKFFDEFEIFEKNKLLIQLIVTKKSITFFWKIIIVI